MSIVFTVSGKILAGMLQRTQFLASAAIANVHIKAKNDMLEVQAELNGRKILVKNAAQVSKSGGFIIDKSLLLGVCKSRDNIKFTCKDNVLHFVDGKFSGKLPTATMPDSLILLKPIEHLPLPKELHQALLSALHSCQLNSVFSDSKLSIFIQLKDDILYVGTSDNYHAALVSIEAKPHLKYLQQFAKPYLLPIDYAKLLHSQFRDSVQFYTEGNRILFVDSNTVLELPTLQTQESTLNSLLEIKTGKPVKLDVSALNSIVNEMPLDKADMYLTFTKGKLNLNVLFKTEHSEIRDEIRLKTRADETVVLKVDHKNLGDILNKISVCKMSYNSNSLKFQEAHKTYFSQLLQKA